MAILNLSGRMCGNAQPITVEKIVSYGIQPYVALSYVVYVLSNNYEVNMSFTHTVCMELWFSHITFKIGMFLLALVTYLHLLCQNDSKRYTGFCF